MPLPNNASFISDISKKEFPLAEKVNASTLRKSLLAIIQQEHTHFNNESCLSIDELNSFRAKYISAYLTNEIGELSQLENNVVSSLNSQSLLTEKINSEEEQTPLSLAQKLADRVAAFGGSWFFIVLFLLMIFVWIITNVFWFTNKGFDPYPFILLNLILSCVAALQAPIIMMSQNRQEEKDRDRAKKDYMINLKSELEIRILHEKIDHFVMRQQQELIEIQKVQIDMMKDIQASIIKSNA